MNADPLLTTGNSQQQARRKRKCLRKHGEVTIDICKRISVQLCLRLTIRRRGRGKEGSAYLSTQNSRRNHRRRPTRRTSVKHSLHRQLVPLLSHPLDLLCPTCHL